MDNLDKICRLCLEKCDNFEPLVGNAKDNLDILLLLEIDLVEIKEPVICSKCTETLIQCVDFKTTCFNTNKSIIPLINNKDKTLNLGDVYLNIKKYFTGLPENRDVLCGLCIAPVESCSATPLIGDSVLDKMMEKCLPELDISIMKEPVICASCRASLKNCFNFLTNCLATEEKIRKYCEAVGKNCEGLIELNSVLQFTIRNTVSVSGCDTVDVIKVERQLCEETDPLNIEVELKNCSVIEMSDLKLDGSQQFPSKNLSTIGDVDRLIKSEENVWAATENASGEVEYDSKSFMEGDDKKFNYSSQITQHTLIFKEEGNKFDTNKIEEDENRYNDEDFAKTENLYFPNEDVEIKTDEHGSNGLQDRVLLPHSEVASNLPDLGDSIAEPQLKRTSKRKKGSRSTIHRCAQCSYQTKYKKDLNTHSLVHKNLSEITMYQCEFCPFQAKHKNYLRKHSFVHKDASELTMHKCEFCSYQTKYKQNITKHSLVHKNPSEIPMHRCDVCSYQSKYKRALDRHKLVHKDLLLQENPSDVPLLKCEFCPFRTILNYALKSHMLKHKDPSEVTMYQCDHCSYQTRHKSALSAHNVTHKDDSETTMYSCESCSFQTKHKRVLRAHLLTHKNPSEVTMHRCEFCQFQTKRKHYLKVHLLVHKDPSEVPMYQCESCLFQTKRKSTIRKHILMHGDSSA